ncbi:MAG: GNAT family protein [Methanogenium sp.]
MNTFHYQYKHKNVYLVPYDFSPSPPHWYFDPEVTKFNSWGTFTLSPETETQALKEAISGRKMIMWKIYYREEQEDSDDELKVMDKFKWIGNVSIQSLDWVNSSAEFAILIGEKDYWGKGVASSALFLCMQHVFSKLGLYRFWSGTSEFNKGMQKVFSKFHWSKEGTFRQAKIVQGDYTDIYEYSHLRHEYEMFVNGLLYNTMSGE